MRSPDATPPAPPRPCGSISRGPRRSTCDASARPTRSSMALIVGIDTGGTFTDLVALDADEGRVISLKTSSTPGEPGRAILNALGEAELDGGGIEGLTHGT